LHYDSRRRPGRRDGSALHGIVIDSLSVGTYDAAMSERTERTDRPILVVDDDVKIVRLVRMYLERAGYRVIEATDGPSALSAIALEAPALVVLDVMLPEVDGLAVLRAVRRTDQTPVIILSARGMTDDRIAGLTAGADDYLPKPFSPAELVLRVQRILARAGAGGASGASGAAAAATEPIRHADLVVDRSRHEVRIGDRLVALTAVEFRLLVALLEADGRVLTRDQLLDAVYGQDEAEVLDRTVDVHIGRLRDKLGDDAERPRYVATVRGVGYRAAPAPTATVETGDPARTGSTGRANRS
jgi:DNA-binding response OmpR family regulator